VFLAGTSSNLREVVEIFEFAVFPLADLRKFQKTSALITHYDNRPFRIPAGTNKDDLE